MSISEIAKAIEILPDHHLELLHVVRYDPRKLLQKINYFLSFDEIPDYINVVGAYDDGSRGIAIYEFDTRLEFYDILYHEIGHYVYYHVIGQQNKVNWVTKINRSSPMVTEYAKRNASESFAETYSYYVLNRKELEKNQPKFDFMQNVVFKNFEPDISELKF